jgi:hypothetical protein
MLSPLRSALRARLVHEFAHAGGGHMIQLPTGAIEVFSAKAMILGERPGWK